VVPTRNDHHEDLHTRQGSCGIPDRG
jgi:hypothetical protein